MESIKINMNSPQRAFKNLYPVKMIITGDELLITLNKKDIHNMNIGQTLLFKRFIYKEDGTMFPLTAQSKINNIDENQVIHSTIPYMERCRIFSYEKKGEDYIITTEEHNIFAQDITQEQEVYLYSSNDTKIATITNDKFRILNKYSLLPIQKEETLTSFSQENECNSFKVITTYCYTFLPDSFSQNKLLISGNVENIGDIISKAAYIRTKFNPFYFYYENDKGENQCSFYADSWWIEFKNSETAYKKYINSGNTISIMGLNDAYWNVGTGLSLCEENESLGSEDSFNCNFLENVKDSLIPEIVDMERVKYSPIYNEEIITGLTLDFHFRKRITDKNGWYIDPDKTSTTWWNGITKTGATTIDKINMGSFIRDMGKYSDLLTDLNFNENDVFYRKKKVGQTFVRLSFCSKKDKGENINPLNERLLYYSTIFFDEGKLYGKYIKAKNEEVEIGKSETRIDSEITITNEFDRTASSEGFNIYLFKEDAPNSRENTIKTIYMKVEFNHAGNGQTIPMILENNWPKDGIKYVSLTKENYFESLYIPIDLKYINDRYYYTIQGVEPQNGNLRLILLEPKLDMPNGNS